MLLIAANCVAYPQFDPFQAEITETDSTPIPYWEKMDAVFAKMDMSEVPSGYLVDRSFPLENPMPFNGEDADSLKANLEIFRKLYGTMFSAALNFENQALSLPDAYESYVTQDSADVFPVAFLWMEYQHIRPYALDSQLIEVINEQIYDKTGPAESPFCHQKTTGRRCLERKAFAAAKQRLAF